MMTMMPGMIVVVAVLLIMMHVLVVAMFVVMMMMVMVMVAMMTITVASVPLVLAVCPLSIKAVVVVVVSHACSPVPAAGSFLETVTTTTFCPYHVFFSRCERSFLDSPSPP
jgi:hypothetical protein